MERPQTKHTLPQVMFLLPVSYCGYVLPQTSYQGISIAVSA
jgi:hypothetical protein